MNKLVSLFAFILLVSKLYSQTGTSETTDRLAIDRVSGGLLYVFQYEDVKGSPFFSDEWRPSEVVVGNAMFKDVQLKFDIINNEFIFKRNDTNYRLGPDVSKVKMFSKGGDSTVFKNGFEIGNAVKRSKYVQILVDGKIVLLKNLKKNIEEYSEYGDATKYKRFIENYEYYTFKDGKFESARINKKDLQSLLADKWDKVSQYMTQNNLSGKDEKSFAVAINYYNSL